MSAKPSVIATWASSGAITTPTAGKKAAGWVPSERAAAQYFNFLHNTAGLWQQYLSDGAMSGAFTFDSTIDCTTGYRGAAGAAALFPSGLSSPNPGQYTTAQFHELGLETAFNDTSVCNVNTASSTRSLSSMVFTPANLVPMYLPVPGLIPGDVITATAIDLTKNTTGGATFTADIVYWTSAGETASGAAYSNSGSAGAISFPGVFNITVASGRRYYVKLTPANSVTPSADLVTRVAVAWKHP